MLITYKTWFIVLMLILCPPLGIILMVKNSFWEQKMQVLAGILSVFWLIGVIFCCSKFFFREPTEEDRIPVVTATPVPTTPSPTTIVTPTTTPTNHPQTTPISEPTSSEPPSPEETSTHESVNPIEGEGEGEIDAKQSPMPTGNDKYNLTDGQISKLDGQEKYVYLLGRELYANNTADYNLSATAVTQNKYDILIDIDNSNKSPLSITQELKIICETIYKLGYKQQTMQIVLKSSGDIATIRDFSTEIIPVVNCSIFENKTIIKTYITIDIY